MLQRVECSSSAWTRARAAVFVGSPYDADAHDARKATTSWVGYTIHVTGACRRRTPRLITHVETTAAPVVDAAALPLVHQALHKRELLPVVQLVDSGYLDAPQIVAAQEDHAIALRGPARPDYQWQARAGTDFALDDFQLDWDGQRATCPAGRTSISWRQRPDPAGRDPIWVKFSSKDCGPCPSRPACCRAQSRSPRRTLCLRPRPQFEARRARRSSRADARRGGPYARRAGIEGTLARGVRRCRLRRTRYRSSRRSSSAISSPRPGSISCAPGNDRLTCRDGSRSARRPPASSPSRSPPESRG